MNYPGEKFSLHAFFDPTTFTLTYVAWDASTKDAVVIDPVIDFDPATQLVSTKGLQKLFHFCSSLQLNVHWILETHAHADHLTGGRELKAAWPHARWGMGSRMAEVFSTFHKLFAWPQALKIENLRVDRWFRDGEEFTAGNLRLQAIQTPGHTPACVTYKVGNSLFTGDALMMPDFGVGRCDFPGGSAEQLYDSIWGKLYNLPDHYKVFVGHDYQPGGRTLKYQSTIGEEREQNIHLKASTAKADFVAFRKGRDATLSAPRLLNPSLDWNLGAHQLVKPLK